MPQAPMVDTERDASGLPPASSQEPSRGPKVDSTELAVAIRNSVKLGGSLLMTWTVAVIVKLQIPKHLGPVRQGHFAFAESFATMFFSVVGLGVDRYIMKEVSVRPAHASDFMGGILTLQTVLSVLLFGAMATTLWATGRSVEIQFAVAVFGCTQYLTYVNQTLAAILQATSHIGRFAIANVAAKLAWGLGLLIGLHFNAPLFALALPMLGAEVLRAMFLVPAVRSSANLRYRIMVRDSWSVVVASLPFLINAIAGGFSNNLAMSTLEFIRHDEREVGWFAATQNLGSLAMLMYPLLAWVVMPMLSRARARSNDEMMFILRRTIEALIVIIVPAITLMSAGSDVFIRLAFGERYAQAATGLSILSLVFLMFYMSIVLATGLAILGKQWSVTVICSTAILIMGGCVLVFVPIGRAIFGVGGECAGAAMAVIANEVFMVVGLLSRYTETPFDRRNVSVLLRSGAIAGVVLLVNHVLAGLGAWRLLADFSLYLALALAAGVVRPADTLRVLRLLRARRGAGQAQPV